MTAIAAGDTTNGARDREGVDEMSQYELPTTKLRAGAWAFATAAAVVGGPIGY